MSFLTDESPSRVMSFLSVAISSLTMLMVINISEASFAEVKGVMSPVVSTYTYVESQVASIPDFVTEAVYATAINLGVIPESKSVYVAVDFPPAGHIVMGRYLGTVAGASIATQDFIEDLGGYEDELVNPVSSIKFMLGR